MCGKIEKLSDWNKNWCDSRYGHCDYDSGDKKTKRQKRQKGKKTKIQKIKKTKRQKCKKTKTKGPPCPPQELEQAGHRPPKF